PQRVRSLVSIMSTTGDPSVGQPHEAAMAALLQSPPATLEDAMRQGVEAWRLLGSPGFAFDEERVRSQAAAAYGRAFHPAGVGRQMVAILSSGDRTAALRALDCPSLVVHGEADILVDPSGGQATAAAIPGAELVMVSGMGHDLPRELFEEMADRVSDHAHPQDRRLGG
ncbi:MAG: alpha/beta fold hydrolase, partial [Acidimicrobiales bacterium]